MERLLRMTQSQKRLRSSSFDCANSRSKDNDVDSSPPLLSEATLAEVVKESSNCGDSHGSPQIFDGHNAMNEVQH